MRAHDPALPVIEVFKEISRKRDCGQPKGLHRFKRPCASVLEGVQAHRREDWTRCGHDQHAAGPTKSQVPQPAPCPTLARRRAHRHRRDGDGQSAVRDPHPDPSRSPATRTGRHAPARHDGPWPSQSGRPLTPRPHEQPHVATQAPRAGSAPRLWRRTTRCRGGGRCGTESWLLSPCNFQPDHRQRLHSSLLSCPPKAGSAKGLTIPFLVYVPAA